MHFTHHTPGQALLMESQCALMGTAQGVLLHSATALLCVHRQVASHLALRRGQGEGVFCCVLLSSSISLGFGISCRVNLFLLPQCRYPPEWGPWHKWSPEVLLYSYSKSKTSASSQLALPPLWLQSSRSLSYLHQPCAT